MKKQALFASVCAGFICMGLVTTADASLMSRLGGQAYYDDVLDITWLADANYAKTSDFDADGKMTWGNAKTWADSLNIDGVTGWRLPTMIDTNTPGCNFSTTGGTDCGYNVQTGSAATTVYSEMASLWTDTLGNLPYYSTGGVPSQSGWGLTNTGPFSNIQFGLYWSGLEYAPDANSAWYFDADFGVQNPFEKINGLYGWAVRSGDVGEVPVPAAAWLFFSGIIGLSLAVRRRHDLVK